MSTERLLKNPFTLSFGREPGQHVARLAQTSAIVNAFISEEPASQVMMITGVRGSGKTVMITEISRLFRDMDDWIVVDLNPGRDLLQALAARLYAMADIYNLIAKAKISLSIPGIGISYGNVPPVTDVEAALELLVERVKMQNKRLLITIDEAVPNQYIREFAGAFQILVRHDQPVHLLMTGLYENIYDLQNDKSLTFLYRAPKVILEPLNTKAMRQCYIFALGVDESKASEMAKLTKGYPFAFQVLGYLYWQHETVDSLEELIPEFDQYLEEFVYDKIWSELSELDRKLAAEIAERGNAPVSDLRDALHLSSGQMGVYRERLKRKGIIDTSIHGQISFALPRFAEFVKAMI